MNHTPEAETLPEELFSLTRLSRKLDVPYSQMFALLNGNTITPDFIVDRNYFFRASRFPEIKAAVEAATAD